MSVSTGTDPSPPKVDWAGFERSPEFQDLVRARRRFLAPVLAFYAIAYGGFLLLVAFAPDFMGEMVVHPFNVGFIWGLLLILVTWVVTFMYLRYSENELDPLAARAVAPRGAPPRTPAPEAAVSSRESLR